LGPEKGVLQKTNVLPLGNAAMARIDAYGVYFHLRAWSKGQAFRVSVPK